MKSQRIWAAVGLILMAICLLSMIGGMFVGAARDLLLLIALCSFLGAAAVLMGLKALRKRQESQETDKAE